MTEDTEDLLSLEGRKFIDKKSMNDSRIGEYPANGRLKDKPDNLLEGKILQKVEGNLLAGKKKKKDFRMEEDTDNKLPGIRKDNDCGKENTLPTQRTPTRVSKDRNRNQGKQTLGLSPLSKKIGNNQMK